MDKEFIQGMLIEAYRKAQLDSDMYDDYHNLGYIQALEDLLSSIEDHD